MSNAKSNNKYYQIDIIVKHTSNLKDTHLKIVGVWSILKHQIIGTSVPPYTVWKTLILMVFYHSSISLIAAFISSCKNYFIKAAFYIMADCKPKAKSFAGNQ